jgi:N-acetylglucosamine-6-phosphate deacetylase
LPDVPEVSTRFLRNVRAAGSDGTPVMLKIAAGRVEEWISHEGGLPAASAQVIDGGGRIISGGYIDIHVHGGGGFDLMTDDPEQVRGFARWVVRHGVTSFLISTSGRDHAQILRRLRALAPLAGKPEPGAARVLGFHLEGPYINPARKGAFDPRWLRPPDAREYEELFEASGGAIRQITLAPELPGADELIGAVVASGAVAAMGHTDATYEQALRALDLGVSHITHCFNAMRPFSHREPGALGVAFDPPMTYGAPTVELIGDGAHVGWVAARLLRRARGDTRGIVLITDGMPLAGTPDGEGAWEGVPIRVEGGKAVRVVDGTIIGGVTTLDQMVRNAVEYIGAPVDEAVGMASRNPAAALRLGSEYGNLFDRGGHADFMLLDDDLHVTETWVAGERVWAAEVPA